MQKNIAQFKVHKRRRIQNFRFLAQFERRSYFRDLYLKQWTS